MRQFKYFICGLISAIAFMPIIDKIFEVINLWLESKKAKPLDKVVESNKKVAMLSDFINPQQDGIEFYTGYMDVDDEEGFY